MVRQYEVNLDTCQRSTNYNLKQCLRLKASKLMVVCSVIGCKSRTDRMEDNISFHTFPHDYLRDKWIAATGRQNWKPPKSSRICSKHFEAHCIRKMLSRVMIMKSATPSLFLPVKTQPAPAHPLPGQSNVASTKTSGANASFAKRDPPSKSTIEQCRFCGEFSKDCVSVVITPYLSSNRTTLAFNNVIVQIDFNDQTLPKTVCADCDAKLQDMFNFVTVVKNAQRSLVNVEVDETTMNQLETLVVKTECEDSNDENDGKDDSNCENDDVDDHDDDLDDEKDDDDEEEESKDGIVDSLIASETIFIKQSVAPKRKSTTSATNLKKAKVTERSEEDNELIVDIKKEVIENDTNDGDNNTGCVSDTGTDDNDKPSEVELTTSTK